MHTMTATGVMNDTALPDLDSAAAAATAVMDEDAFRAFYDRTSRAVWVYLARMTSDRQLADDLLQETFYRFFRLGAVHETESHRRNSLFCIATNIARDANRRKRRSPQAPMPADLDQVLGYDERIAERFEGSTDLARAMAHLKPVQQEMLWLAYALGASHDEIAGIVGLKKDSIKIILFRARRKLAALLGRKS
jgi:RNA polymerase sigma-70 factor (ECF subfamily)